ncbi:unnamed protein product [Calypogeia fissa]
MTLGKVYAWIFANPSSQLEEEQLPVGNVEVLAPEVPEQGDCSASDLGWSNAKEKMFGEGNGTATGAQDVDYDLGSHVNSNTRLQIRGYIFSVASLPEVLVRPPTINQTTWDFYFQEE